MSVLKEVLAETYLPKAAEDGTKKRTKVDDLVDFEKQIQAKWAEAKVFEVDGEEEKAPKYMATCPYPYMNGRLHVGHMFTISKSCFAVFYHRLKGEKALYPFGFHCTGMPIKACADKLKDDLARFGPTGPPRPSEEEMTAARDAMKQLLQDQLKARTDKKAPAKGKGKGKAKAAPKGDPTKHTSKRSKAESKKGVGATQWEIMRTLGLTDEEIACFTDPQHWLKYFPQHCKADLDAVAAGVDWRRSFITTDANPYYDSFVRWQFILLSERNKLIFGKRPTIFSPKDGQPCMDHDRKSGEGVGVTTYSIIKMRVQEPLPEVLAPVKDFEVYAVPATLRPETMYGQTNCWVQPNGKYGAFQINDKEVFICSHRAARNMAFQGLSVEAGKVTCLVEEILGSQLVGCELNAPLSAMGKVRMLPMATVSMGKGTGVVTSVPSDSVDDYTNLKFLQDKEKIRNDLGVQESWVTEIEIKPIVETPLGDLSAIAAHKKYKISSPKDTQKLLDAKDETYKGAFYQGKMLVGEFAGQMIQDCKEAIVAKLVADNFAAPFHEPDGEVISRSGDECVVAITDQWYLNYGDEEWKTSAKKALEQMKTFHPESEQKLARTIDWLHEWPCSRTYGLGTKLPCDEKWLIESLSDSTIYMAYYAISHFLQGDIYGQTQGSAGIPPEKMTREVYDYIFLGTAYPADCGIEEAMLAKLRQEFNFWYPMDMRASGKDLLSNHLTFAIFNHTAIWPDEPERWPQGIRSNGHMKLNNEKMSKSTGNFLTVVDCVELFGADATRYTIAQAGDGGDSDANFECDVANKAILKLHTTITRAEQLLAADSRLSEEREADSFADKSFANEISRVLAEADAAYEDCQFRAAAILTHREMNRIYGVYKAQCDAAGCKMATSLVRRFVESQAIMAVPITPHWSERIWQLLGNAGFAVQAAWPAAASVDDLTLKRTEYIRRCLDQWVLDVQKSKKPVKGAVVVVATAFPEWQQQTYANALKAVVDGLAAAETAGIAALKADPQLRRHMKLAGPLTKSLIESVGELAAKQVRCTFAFDEVALLKENLAYISATLSSVRKNSKDDFSVSISTTLDPKAKNQALPYQPILNVVV